MNRLYPVALLAAMLALAVYSRGLAQHPARVHCPPTAPCPTCPTCVYGPHPHTVRTILYTTKEEPFCLTRLSLRGLFSHSSDCCNKECITRSKTRLVKIEVDEPSVKMKCAVEQAAPPPTWLRRAPAPGLPVITPRHHPPR